MFRVSGLVDEHLVPVRVCHGFVRALAAAGARVVVADVDEAGAQPVLGPSVAFRSTDFANDQQVASLVAETAERHGGE